MFTIIYVFNGEVKTDYLSDFNSASSFIIQMKRDYGDDFTVLNIEEEE